MLYALKSFFKKAPTDQTEVINIAWKSPDLLKGMDLKLAFTLVRLTDSVSNPAALVHT